MKIFFRPSVMFSTVDVQRGKFIVLTSAVANDGDIIVTAVFGFSFGVNFALQEDKDVFLHRLPAR